MDARPLALQVFPQGKLVSLLRCDCLALESLSFSILNFYDIFNKIIVMQLADLVEGFNLQAPWRNHPLLLLSGVGTNAIEFDLSSYRKLTFSHAIPFCIA
ncbi:hypothetical protein ACLOJK_035554 [Asimina triloba]